MAQTIKQYIEQLHDGNKLALARCITIVENNLVGATEILHSLNSKKNVPIIGITGPPGAGKSTLVNALIETLTKNNSDFKIGIVAIDPTSPFNYGSLLGDRVRMANHFNNPNIFIRSLATRGSLGGLSAKTIEITDVMRASDFDYIIVETVGVGQSEVEIVGLADTTIVVLVPEAGDDVQALKSGIMEIADIFVVNKADRAGANTFLKNIYDLLHSQTKKEWNTTVIKTVASKSEGIDELIESIKKHQSLHLTNHKKYQMIADKVYTLIQSNRMKDISKSILLEHLQKHNINSDFNIYKFAEKYFEEKNSK
jgi:LAO/AO transport system kinase